MITMNMVVGIGIACLFVGVFLGFALFAFVSVFKQADERAPQPEERIPHIDIRA